MARPREVIEQAERVLDRGISERAAVEQIAMQYCEVTNELRARLGQALDCARRGLRLEVRSIADARPPLIETATLFTASAAVKWREFCTANRFPVPPRISEETIAELQEALNALLADRFEALHAIFRQQNLALAPTYQRLRTLRLIAKRDAANPMWAEDIDRFEVESIRELQSTFASAIKHDRLDEAQEIVETLRLEDWVRRDAPRSAARCEKRLWGAQAEQAAARAASVSQQMYAHYMAESFEGVRTTLEAWDALGVIAARGGIALPEGPSTVVRPIVEWMVAREAEMQVAHETRSQMDGLERVAVDGTASADEIQTRLVQAERMPGGVPDELRELAQRRVDEHTSRIRVRRTMKFVGGGAIAAAVLAAAIWIALDQLHQQAQSQFAEAFAAAVERRDDGECARLLAQAQSDGKGFDKDARVLEAQARLTQALADDVEQDARFESAFAAAGDPTVVSGRSDSIDSAAQLARGDTHRERIQAWRDARAAADVRAQQARDGAFLAQVKSMASQIDALSSLAPESKEAIAQLERIEILAANIGSSTAIGKEARAAFEMQRGRLSGSRDLANHESRRAIKEAEAASTLAALVAASSDPDRLEVLLGEFSNDHPDSPYTADFREAVSNGSSWRPVLAWLALTPTLTQVPFPKLAQDRDAIRQGLEKFRTKYPTSLLDGSIRAYAALLADSKGWTDWLNNILRTWTPMEMNMVELDTGERYYYLPGDLPKPASTPGIEVFQVVTSWTDEKRGPVRIERKRIKSEGESPQAKLRARLLPLIRGVSATTTAEGALEVIRMIRDDTAVDPVARAYLIHGLLSEMRGSLPQHAKAIDRALNFLGEEDLAEIDWLAAGNPTKRVDYKRVQELLVSALPLADWVKSQAVLTTQLNQWLASKLRCVGIFDRTVDPARVLIAAGAKLKAGEKLYAVASPQAQPSRIIEVGSVQGEGAMRFNSAARNLPSGTVVFAGTWTDGPPPPPTEAQ